MYISPSSALFIDFLATCICQGGYIVQKKAHQSVEKFNADQDTPDKHKSGFITCGWFLGFVLAGTAGILHAGISPFADIVLLSCNAATAIVVQVIFSVIFLGEKFVCRYDLTALIFIVLGCICIVITANFSDNSLDAEMVKDYLTSGKSIAFFATAFTLLNLIFFALKRMKFLLAKFEQDVEKWLLQNCGIQNVSPLTTLNQDENQLLMPSQQIEEKWEVETVNNTVMDLQTEESQQSQQLTEFEDNRFQRADKVNVIRKEPKRSIRQLIKLIQDCPRDFVACLSPEVGPILKSRLALPLLFLALGASVFGGTSIVMMKCCGEIANSSEAGYHMFFAICLAVVGLAAAALQTYLLNLNMKYFSQLDVMPTYQAILLISWMVSGLVLLDESALYSWVELLQLGGCCLLVCVGIFILTRKHARSDKKSGSETQESQVALESESPRHTECKEQLDNFDQLKLKETPLALDESTSEYLTLVKDLFEDKVAEDSQA